MSKIALSRADYRLAFVVLGVVALVPLGIRSEYWLGVVITGLYFAMLAQSWNFLAGITGLFSMAPAAFAMVGAYTTGLLYHHAGLGPWVGVPAAALVSAAVGFGLGRITLRLRGAYLALTTLAFSEILRLVIANSIEWTRGDLGLSVVGIFGGAKVPILYLFLGVLAAYQALLMLLLRSRVGLFLLAIRDDEVGAVARGVDVVRYKTLAFTISSAGCGLAGALFVHFLQFGAGELEEVDEQRPSEATAGAGDGEGERLVANDVHAASDRAHLVVADGQQEQADAAAQQQHEQHLVRREHAEEEIEDRHLRAAEDPQHAQSEVAPRPLDGVGDDETQDLRERQRGERQVRAAQPERDSPQSKSHRRRDQRRGGHTDPRAEPRVVIQQPGRVGADHGEGRWRHREEPGDASQQVPVLGEHREVESGDDDAQPVLGPYAERHQRHHAQDHE